MRRPATWKLDDQSEMINSDVLNSQKYPLQYLAKAYRAYVKSENLRNCPKGRSQRKNGGECFAPLLCIYFAIDSSGIGCGTWKCSPNSAARLWAEGHTFVEDNFQKSEMLPIVIWMRQAATWKLDDQSEMTNSNVLSFQEYPLQYLAKAYRAYVKSENLGNRPKGRSQRKNGGECFAPLLCI